MQLCVLLPVTLSRKRRGDLIGGFVATVVLSHAGRAQNGRITIKNSIQAVLTHCPPWRCRVAFLIHPFRITVK